MLNKYKKNRCVNSLLFNIWFDNKNENLAKNDEEQIMRWRILNLGRFLNGKVLPDYVLNECAELSGIRSRSPW